MTMNIWHDIDPKRISPDDLLQLSKSPKAARLSTSWTRKQVCSKWTASCTPATHYPANYGFIPRTYAADNDPLDVLVLCSENVVPMTLMRCYPIGVIIMEDSGDMDEKSLRFPSVTRCIIPTNPSASCRSISAMK